MSVERLASRLKQVPGTFSRPPACGIRGGMPGVIVNT